MQKYLSLLLLVLLPVLATAQETIIYFDKDWKPVSKKKNAAFYRPLPKKEGELYKVIDYYINGKVQMTGCYAVENPQVLMQDGTIRARKQGIFKYHDSDGKLRSQEEYKDGVPHGKWTGYNEKGEQRNRTEWDNGKQAGDWTVYYDASDKIWYTASYIMGKQNGAFKSYYPDGKLKRDAIYENGMLLSGKMFDTKGSDIPFTPFEQMPSPAYDLGTYLSSNIVYPNKARLNNIEGRVLVQFNVDETGKITDAFVKEPVHPALDKEALRVVASMPDWNPGKQDDKPVKVYYTLPVRFQLE